MGNAVLFHLPSAFEDVGIDLWVPFFPLVQGGPMRVTVSALLSLAMAT